jgi:heme-degrading monooxygenase HmoA
MMTVITRTVLREGTEPEWDAAMRERLDAAGGRGGWIGGQLLIPLERLNERLIVGTWDTRADWEAWHSDEAFHDTRLRIEGLEKRPSETNWYEVMAEQRGPA